MYREQIKRIQTGADGAELDGTGSERKRRCASGEEEEIEREKEPEIYKLDSRTIDNRIAHGAK